MKLRGYRNRYDYLSDLERALSVQGEGLIVPAQRHNVYTETAHSALFVLNIVVTEEIHHEYRNENT